MSIQSKKPFVIAMIGLVGSGKSFVARKVSDMTGAEIVSSDAIRVSQGDFTQETVRAEAVQRLKALVSSGKNAVLDSDFVDEAKRKELTEAAARMGVHVYFIRVHADLDVMIGRAIAERYEGGPTDIFSRAATRLIGAAQERGQAVKIREMIRRISQHYSWSDKDGGEWTLLPLPASYLGDGVIADIDATDPSDITSTLEIAVRKVL